jgi:prepilin-type N-terminal cleavage/methylation domain-containing protein
VRFRGKPQTSASGFTLVELAVVLLIIAVIAGLTVTSFTRAKPRADMKTAAGELQALLHQARETALSSGNPVYVLVYKGFTPGASGSGIGYFIVYQDACAPVPDFMTGGGTCGVSFAAYNPAVLAAGGSSVIVDTMTLPNNLMVGPTTGMGVPLAAPLQNVAVNTDCSFCGSTGGAVQFDASGQATFFSLAGGTVTALGANGGGGSLSLTYNPDVTGVTGQMTLVIFSASGAVQVFGTG